MDRPPPALSIAEVERDTGLGKDTLRAWERRYGFPRPGRNALGERVYTIEEVKRLRGLQRLVRAGHRPGKLTALDDTELDALLATLAPASVPAEQAEQDLLAAVEQALAQHQADVLRSLLLHALSRLGLAGFVCDVMAPLTTRVGQAWTEGRLQVFEEHLFTEIGQSVLHVAIQTLPPHPAEAAPRVLLTTLPGEPHALGLLMAEAMCALEGCACINLGAQTPLVDIVKAGRSHQVDVVGLSATACLPTRQLMHSVDALQRQLDPGVTLWLGGSAGAQPPRRPRPGVRHFADLRAIGPAVAEWRQAAARCAPAA